MTVINSISEFRSFWATQKQAVLNSEFGEIIVAMSDIMLVSRNLIEANFYNPNPMDEDEIFANREILFKTGFNQPIVIYFNSAKEKFEVLDGVQRLLLVGKIDFVPCVCNGVIGDGRASLRKTSMEDVLKILPQNFQGK